MVMLKIGRPAVGMSYMTKRTMRKRHLASVPVEIVVDSNIRPRPFPTMPPPLRRSGCRTAIQIIVIIVRRPPHDCCFRMITTNPTFPLKQQLPVENWCGVIRSKHSRRPNQRRHQVVLVRAAVAPAVVAPVARWNGVSRIIPMTADHPSCPPHHRPPCRRIIPIALVLPRDGGNGMPTNERWRPPLAATQWRLPPRTRHRNHPVIIISCHPIRT